jgi:hypothetical protein
MVTPPDIEAQILRFYHTEKWTIGTIARQLHIHNGVVRRVLAQAGLPKIGRSPRKSLIDAYLPFIRQTLETFPTLTTYGSIGKRLRAPRSTASNRLRRLPSRGGAIGLSFSSPSSSAMAWFSSFNEKNCRWRSGARSQRQACNTAFSTPGLSRGVTEPGPRPCCNA